VLGLNFHILLPNTMQSDPLCGSTGCRPYFLHLLPNAGQTNPLSGGDGCRYFQLSQQKVHGYEI